MDKEIEVEVLTRLRVPRVPNFILTTDDENQEHKTIALKAIPKQSLKVLADEWRKELFKKAGYAD